MDKTLVTGTSSGLGKFLCEELNGTPYNRFKKTEVYGNHVLNIQNDYDMIVHAAFDTSKNVYNVDYLDKSMELLDTLLHKKFKHFTFISTVDVYPKTDSKEIVHYEDEKIDLNKVVGMYAISKIMAEQKIMKHCSSYTILRISSVIGKYMKNNILYKLSQKKNISISTQSVFNIIRDKVIADFIKSKPIGIFNLVGSKNVELINLADVGCGEYIHKCPNVSGEKSGLTQTSLQYFVEWANNKNVKDLHFTF